MSETSFRSLEKALANKDTATELVLYKPESISGTIAELENLQSLKIIYSELEKLPDVIRTLTNLKRLILNNNKLTALPDLSGLQSLQFLDVHGNRLTKVPHYMAGLPCLKIINLRGNKALSRIPPDLMEKPGCIVLVEKEKYPEAIKKRIETTPKQYSYLRQNGIYLDTVYAWLEVIHRERAGTINLASGKIV